MPAPEHTMPDLVAYLTHLHDLLRTTQVSLREAMKIALGVDPRILVMHMDWDDRIFLDNVWQALQARVTEFHPPYTDLGTWLFDQPGRESILALVENLIYDTEKGVRQ